MRSVADELRAERRTAVEKLPAAERLALALELGDRDLRAFQRASDSDRDAARRKPQRRRRVGREPSRCLDAAPR